MSSKHVPIDTVINLNTNTFSKKKCNNSLHDELDDIIKRVVRLMKKTEKCELIETRTPDLVATEKPRRKKYKKVATMNKETRAERLDREAGLTRREMLLKK
jgi:hypothetical protein